MAGFDLDPLAVHNAWANADALSQQAQAHDQETEQAAQLAAAMGGIPIEQARILARQKRGQMLSAAPLPEVAKSGRFAVAASPLEFLATAMNRYRGNRMQDDAEAALGPLAQRAQQASALQYREARADKAFQQGMLKDRLALDKAKAEQDAIESMGKDSDSRASRTEQARHNKALEDAAAATREQDAWGYGQDASGGGVLYNKKTADFVPLSPRGPGLGSPYPGKGHDMEKDVQSLGKDLEPVGQMKSDLATLDAFVAKGDVPGFGPVAGRVPDVVASNDAIAARQAAKRIMAAYIQMRSGTAASDKEVERLLAANGLGPTATPEAIRQGVTSLRRAASEQVGRMEAKYHPDVVSTYKARGGVSRSAFEESAPAIKADEELRKKYGL